MTPKKKERKEEESKGLPLLSTSDCRKALQVEVRRARSLVKEIAANYVSKLEGRAEDVSAFIEELEIDPKDDFPRLIKKFRELDLKPHKGRRKDLRQLDDVLESLRVDIETLLEKQDRAKGEPKPESKSDTKSKKSSGGSKKKARKKGSRKAAKPAEEAGVSENAAVDAGAEGSAESAN